MLVQFYEEKSAFRISRCYGKKVRGNRMGKRASLKAASFPSYYLFTMLCSLSQHFAQVANCVGIALKKLDLVHDA